MNRRKFLSTLATGGAAVAATLSVHDSAAAVAQTGTEIPSSPGNYAVYLPQISQGAARPVMGPKPPPVPADLMAKARELQPPVGAHAIEETFFPPDAEMPVVQEQIVGPDGAPTSVLKVKLPRRLLKNEGTLLEDFEHVTDWVISRDHAENNYPEGTIAENKDQKLTGGKSLKVTPNFDRSSNQWYYPLVEEARTLNLGAAPTLQWSYFNHKGAKGDLEALWAMLWSGQYASNFNVSLPNNSQWFYDRPGAWNTVRVQASDWQIHNGDSWTTPRSYVSFGITSGGGSQGIASPTVVSLDNFRGGVQPVPAVMLSVDDNDASVYDAFVYARAHGVRATAYVVTDWIGLPGYLTVAQLKEMQAGDWAIANHTSDHKRLAEWSQADAQASLQAGRKALEGWGLREAAKHVAYPNGSYNANVLAAMEAEGMLTGRTTEGAPYFMPDDPLRIPCRTFDSLVQIEGVWGAKWWVDQAIARNELLIAYCHALENTTGTESVSWGWTLPKWKALIDHIVSKQLPTINILDFHKLLTGSVDVTLPY